MASRIIKAFCADLVKAKRVEQKHRPTSTDILSVAVESGEFSDDDLVNQMMTFLLAGHETTASALGWAICLLCQHPAMQTRLSQEIRNNLPDPRRADSTITCDVVDRLPFLNAVCNEVLRLYPPVFTTLRVAARDTSILGHFVPKGTTIILSPRVVNTLRTLWGDDAAEFNPERWMGQGKMYAGGSDSNYSFLTFLHGPRSCIGQNFARAEFACLLAAWTGAFDTEFEDPDYVVEIQRGFTVKPRALKVRIRPADEW